MINTIIYIYTFLAISGAGFYVYFWRKDKKRKNSQPDIIGDFLKKYHLDGKGLSDDVINSKLKMISIDPKMPEEDRNTAIALLKFHESLNGVDETQSK